MTTRTTLRLGGLAAAIVVSLALVSSASASQLGGSSGILLHRSGLWVQHKGGSSTVVVTTARPSIRHVAVGPATRQVEAGPPVTVPVATAQPATSSGFNWTDTAIGALFGLALAIVAVFAAMTLRERRGGIALGA